MASEGKRMQESLVLGALLHDIGKFWQRADKGSASLSQQSLQMEASICKVFDGRYSYRHVLWTSEFFERYKGCLPIDVFAAVSDQPLDNCANLASYHHAPATVLHQIVQQADWLSSGVDRRKTQDAADEYGASAHYRRVRLDSIFEKVNLSEDHLDDEGPPENREWKYELRSLDASREGIFPHRRTDLAPKDGELLTESYQALWEQFVEDLQRLPAGTSYDLRLANLVHLLERYAWCIPSSTMDIPDISLFDHSRSAAAIAACLLAHHQQTGTMDSEAVQDRSIRKFLLVGGDLSGIQRYLFDLVHANVKGVSKILRARSFYLSLLPVIASHTILHRLGLPLLCNLVDAGGRFILLVPNTPETITVLEECRKEFGEWCRGRFQGELVLNIGWDTALSGDDFSSEKFAETMTSFGEGMEAKKLAKLRDALSAKGAWDPDKFKVAEGYDHYADHGACRCCGKLPASKNYPYQAFSDEELGKLCEMCYEQLCLGRWLTERSVIGFSHSRPQTDDVIHIFEGYNVQFFKRIPDDTERLYLIEGLGFQTEREPGDAAVLPRRLLANYVPQFETDGEYDALCQICASQDSCSIGLERKAGQVKTFECLATASRVSGMDGGVAGKPMIGVLKADVDRLGYIFSFGLRGKLSLSRYATMSRMLNVFFTGYLNELLRNEYPSVYTVYSGGDDLFLIGEWKSLIDLAVRLYSDFREYTCQNPAVTLSAGLALVRSKFPINRAATMADELLEQAKERGRDRLTLFDTTVLWKEFDNLKQFAEFLDTQLNDRGSAVNAGFMYRLLQYHRMFKEAKQGRVEQLKFHSLMAYDVQRNIKERSRVVNQRELAQLYRLFDIEKFDSPLMEHLQIPLYYVLYKNRGRAKRGKHDDALHSAEAQ